LSFPDQTVGGSSAPFTVQIWNRGAASLDIHSITITGDFEQVGSCGTSVAKNAICTFSVAFKPAAAGTRSGAVVIVDNAPDSPHLIPLRGTGVGASASGALVSLSATSLTFDPTAIGAASVDQTVTLTNAGTDLLTLTVTTAGEFSQHGNCGASLPAGASCDLSVTFRPAGPGTRTGSLVVDDSAPGAPHTVLLKGTGAGVSGASLAATPAVVSFGARTIGAAGDPVVVSLRNNGSTVVAVSELSVTGDFVATGCVAATLAPSEACTLTIAFEPVFVGTRTGTLTVRSAELSAPLVLALTGEGTRGGLLLAPTSLTFSSQSVGTVGVTQSVVLTNSGSVAIGISGISTTGDFSAMSDCGDRLEAGASCSAAVTFSPTGTGTRTGILSVTGDADGSPHELSLKGTGF
jgi:hypothetical protein